MTEWLDVPRETLERLKIYELLLHKWTSKINLVSPGSLQDVWVRHFEDSRQIHDVAPTSGKWCDLGSGGGFPVMVVAILSRTECPDREFSLIESDQRKAAFLRTVARETGVNCQVFADRIENLAPLQADILTARGLAHLDKLLEYAHRHMRSDGVAILPKGKTWQAELETARTKWSFSCQSVTSRTEPTAAILKISGIKRV